jgi:hypothetical protein
MNMVLRFSVILMGVVPQLLCSGSIIKFPYPSDIAFQITDTFKKIDMEDAADAVSGQSFKELFDDAEISSILIAGLVTKGSSDRLFVHYYEPSVILEDFINNIPGGKKVLTQESYSILRRTYKEPQPNYATGEHTFVIRQLPEGDYLNRINTQGVNFTPPFFVDPINKVFIEDVYFFLIHRAGNANNYTYKADYFGKLSDIVKDPKKVAELVFRLIMNETPELNTDGTKKFKKLEIQKRNHLLKKTEEYARAKETGIAKILKEYILRDVKVSLKDFIKNIDDQLNRQDFAGALKTIEEKRSSIIDYHENEDWMTNELFLHFFNALYSHARKVKKSSWENKEHFIQKIRAIRTNNSPINDILNAMVISIIDQELINLAHALQAI